MSYDIIQNTIKNGASSNARVSDKFGYYEYIKGAGDTYSLRRHGFV